MPAHDSPTGDFDSSHDDGRLIEFHAAYSASTSHRRPQVVDEWCRRFPELAPDIRAFHEMQPQLEFVRDDDRGSTPEEWWRCLHPGHRLGDFEIIGPAGQGGMGVVFRARQLSLKREVALKLTRLDSTDVKARFEREREVFAELHHGSILPVFVGGDATVVRRSATHDVEPHDETIHVSYYAMTLVPGASLSGVLGVTQKSAANSFPDAIKQAAGPEIHSVDASTVLYERPLQQRSPIPVDRPSMFQPNENWVRSVARCVMRLAEAIEYVHNKGWIHCDLKPANVMIERNEHPWVIDFGLARKKRSDQPSVSGTPPYMAPEQFNGLADERTDIFALGEIFYQLLTLELPDRKSVV